mmetsp:Transcript_7742/g.19975  ORF Transcript_7742/g.19975 Transcript_7742/m.19975 type:complete len:203 (-) Transcript_7742:474-1082(-)
MTLRRKAARVHTHPHPQTPPRRPLSTAHRCPCSKRSRRRTRQANARDATGAPRAARRLHLRQESQLPPCLREGYRRSQPQAALEPPCPASVESPPRARQPPPHQRRGKPPCPSPPSLRNHPKLLTSLRPQWRLVDDLPSPTGKTVSRSQSWRCTWHPPTQPNLSREGWLLASQPRFRLPRHRDRREAGFPTIDVPLASNRRR